VQCAGFEEFTCIDADAACHNAGMSEPFPIAVPEVLAVYGSDDCADCRRARRYLDATRVPYRWVDVSADPTLRAALAGAGYEAMPILVLPTGQILVDPSTDELANSIGTAA